MRQLLTLSLLLTAVAGNAQSFEDRAIQIQDRLRESSGRLPPYLIDSVATSFQDGLSGSQVREGKIVGTSLAISEKGATVNLGIRSFSVPSQKKGWDIYPALKFEGRGDDKFVSVFENGSYQQTLSAGGLLNIFPRQFKRSAYCFDNQIMYRRIDALRKILEKEADAKWEVGKQYEYLVTQKKNLAAYLQFLCAHQDSAHCGKDDPIVVLANAPEIEKAGLEALDTLQKLGIVPKGFNPGKKKCRQDALAGYAIPDTSRLATMRFVQESQAAYLKGKWTYANIFWLTVGGNYNIAPKDIIDTTRPDKKYLRSFNSEYATFSLAANFLHFRKYGWTPLQWSLSPTISLSTERPFNDDDKITLTKQRSYTRIPGDTVLQTDFTSSGFESVAARGKLPWSIEMPFALMFDKWGVGLDLAVRAGGNSPSGDNVGGRIGIYVPVDLKEGKRIWIEPVARIGKLFQSSAPISMEDNVVIGFNLAVNLPQFSLGGK
jgi:hypothetical protein